MDTMRNTDLRIMHVVQSLNCGGQEKMIISLAERQRNAGAAVSICALEEAGELSSEAKNKNIPLFYMYKKPGIKPGLIFKLARLIREQRISVLHAHNMGPALYGALASKLSGPSAVIVTRHGRDAMKYNKLIWNMIDAVASISEDTKREFLKNNNIELGKVHVIHNGIDHAFFGDLSVDKAGLRSQLGIADADLVVGSVGRLCPEKDFITLIDALGFIVPRHPGVKLLIVGDGKLRAELEAYCKKSGLSQNVIFAGLRNDVRELLSLFDLFVLSSISEGMPLALLEAMASGKPSVVTSVGGNIEVTVDGVTGFVAPPQEPEALSARIVELLINKELSVKFGEAARTRVIKYFSLDRMEKDYMELYMNVLRKKGLA